MRFVLHTWDGSVVLKVIGPMWNLHNAVDLVAGPVWNLQNAVDLVAGPLWKKIHSVVGLVAGPGQSRAPRKGSLAQLGTLSQTTKDCSCPYPLSGETEGGPQLCSIIYWLGRCVWKGWDLSKYRQQTQTPKDKCNFADWSPSQDVGKLVFGTCPQMFRCYTLNEAHKQ